MNRTALAFILIMASLLSGFAQSEPLSASPGPEQPSTAEMASEPSLDSEAYYQTLIDASRTPVAYFQRAAELFQANQYDAGLRWFIMGQAFGAFDAMRVSDKTAHQATQVLAGEVGANLDQQRYFEAFERLKASGFIDGACENLRRIGPPSYYPQYMIDHGMGSVSAALEAEAGQPATYHVPDLVVGFDPNRAWDGFLKDYFHCQ